jgi:timeless
VCVCVCACGPLVTACHGISVGRLDRARFLLSLFLSCLFPSITNLSLIAQQVELRENALKQSHQLLDYQRLLCRHRDVWSVWVSLLAEPLSRSRRTEADHLTIEVLLHLIRNLLAAQPLFHHANQEDAATARHALVQVLAEELVLDILIVLAADLDQPGSPNAPYNLLIMEVWQSIASHYPPAQVVAALKYEKESAKAGKSKKHGVRPATSSGPSLRGTLQRERQTARAVTSTRHGNFGGSLVLGDAPTAATSCNSKTAWTVSTTQYAQAAMGQTAATSAATTNTHKRTPIFVGATKSHSARHGVAATPAARQAAAVVGRLAQRFLRDGYASFCKSLKNEFRRDSVRLEDGDRVVYLQLVTWFSQVWKGLGQPRTAQQSRIGPLLFSMDVFSFHLVHNAAETFGEHKEYGKLATTVAVYKEMMSLLQLLYDSKEETEQIMALGLLDRLFYGGEPLDRLPKWMSQWQPGQASHQYAADLVELVHMQIKLLEQHAKACENIEPQKKGSKQKAHGPTDAVAKMKAIAADYDTQAYVRKLVTNHTVYLYTQLLANYPVNGARLNHRIVAFLLRVSQFAVVVPEETSDEAPHLLASKIVTLEPMLYNVRLLWVLHTILNDTAANEDKSLATATQFALRIVTRFAQACQANPLMVVEALVKHPMPHRYCEQVTNHYVTEELRMLAERDALLEEQRQWQADSGDEDGGGRPGKDDDDDSEGELEFDDFGVTPGTSSQIDRSSKRKAIEDSDEEDDDEEKRNEEESEKEGVPTSTDGSVAAKRPRPNGASGTGEDSPTSLNDDEAADEVLVESDSDEDGDQAATSTNDPGPAVKDAHMDPTGEEEPTKSMAFETQDTQKNKNEVDSEETEDALMDDGEVISQETTAPDGSRADEGERIQDASSPQVAKPIATSGADLVDSDEE